MRDNIFARGTTGLYGAGMTEGSSSLRVYAPTAVLANNVLIGAKAATYPTPTWLPSSVGLVGFASYTTGDYRVSSSSPYYNRGTDGTSPGADLSTLGAKVANVR
jgi:hypothetical protein